MSVYNFKIENIYGEYVNFSKYKGKTLLIVNIASKCIFANQYKGLEKLYQTYKNQGLVILGFPCSQFMNQEFEENIEINKVCKIKYNVTFEIFSKINIKGEKQNLLYKFLTNEIPWNSQKKDVKWNFEKFLIDRNGNVIKRFSSIITPSKIQKEIEKIL